MTDTLAEPSAVAEAPLFYTCPEPLKAEHHGSWRLLPGDYGFASDANVVMLALSEFADAARSYPILFTGEDGLPVALLGLERKNAFVADGRWAENSYIPAYVRRYPFIFYATDVDDRFVLGIDTESDHVARDGDKGLALFDGEAASAVTTHSLHFCEAFRRDCDETGVFSAMLAERELLIDQRAAVTLADGKSFNIEGFKVIDRDRFAALDDATVLDWHRKGWLAFVNFHLASLGQFNTLLARQNTAPANRAAS